MSIIKHKVLLPVLTLALAGGVVLGTSSVYAQDTQHPQDTIVQKIADRFKVNKDEVQKVFDEHREEHHAQMKQRLEERLTQAVKDGKLTEEQKQELLIKLKEHEAQREKFDGMTLQERRTAMQKERQRLSDWAEQQGINLKDILPGKGMMMHRGMMK